VLLLKERKKNVSLDSTSELESERSSCLFLFLEVLVLSVLDTIIMGHLDNSLVVLLVE
jgi:hypothetical protein